ncbi:hypothetical protein LINPERHAP1_LOCUS33324 [Linum perenne]
MSAFDGSTSNPTPGRLFLSYRRKMRILTNTQLWLLNLLPLNGEAGKFQFLMFSARRIVAQTISPTLVTLIVSVCIFFQFRTLPWLTGLGMT